MAFQSFLERISAGFALLSIAAVVCGTKACQEDYGVGSQSTGTGTTTATPTDEGDGTTRGTPTPATTGTPGSGGATTPTPVAAEPTATPPVAAATGDSPTTVDDGSGLLQELSSLSEGSANQRAAAANANWLGKSFDKEKQDSASGKGDWLDADGDGFADSIENTAGTDPLDPTDIPGSLVSTNVTARVRTLDKDMDGLVLANELKFGTDPGSLDTDGDGRLDGMEVLSGGDPLKSDDRYLDADGDGLSDDYERTNGTNPEALDTDVDGLRDDLEVVLGSNPVKIDTDGDGISDGKEDDLGSDPTVADVKGL